MRYPDSKNRESVDDGIRFQDYVCELLAREHIIIQNFSSKKYQLTIGENLQGIEIKLDNRCIETQRLSIEIAEKTHADKTDWTNSGIYRDDNSWLYIQGNFEIVFIFQKNLLQMLHRTNRYKTGETNTIRKFYLPFAAARKYAGKVIELDDDKLSLR